MRTGEQGRKQGGAQQGVSSSIQSSTVVNVQDGQALTQEQEPPPAEVVPVVAPPSLKEVQQAVQEASEQVEGRGAEEVLKELLERVVEAALGQVEGGGEAKLEDAAVEEGIEEDAAGAENGDAETDTEAEAGVLEGAVEDEVVGEDVDDRAGNTSEEQKVDEMKIEVNTSEDVAEIGTVVVEEESETAAGLEEETTAGVHDGDGEAQSVEPNDDSLDTEVSQDVLPEVVATSEEAEVVAEDSEEQNVLLEEKGEIETQEAEENPAVEIAVVGEPEQETVLDSDLNLGLTDVEQVGEGREKQNPEGEVTQVDQLEDEVIVVVPSDNYEIETTQTVDGEPVEEEVNINILKETEEVEARGAELEEAAGGEKDEQAVNEEESLVTEAREEEQIALETPQSSKQEDQEVLVISARESDDDDDGDDDDTAVGGGGNGEVSIEQSPEGHPEAPTPSPSLSGTGIGENTLDEEKSNHGNEITTPTDDILPHDPALAHPAVESFVKDVLVQPSQVEGEQLGEANELVEDTAGHTEISELGLEAWKIGAISAAVLLVLETIVIVLYILKRRTRSSNPALQRACEEGCVEPEAATGGDYSDDTLPAGNGDTQQITVPDASNTASTLAQNKEHQEGENVIPMSDLPPSSTEDLANSEAGPDPSQDNRTSIL
ncbi:glutamic acid-rich protein [Sphaeramia orbicularis]|uniref:glutamic acid-rich protein n=1 Tax=Sphaeramia orbicularis TaxID=375764 RepID=UPI00117F8750|nr:glutamic acid-rich protein-like [Sphaeramia orbicularis]